MIFMKNIARVILLLACTAVPVLSGDVSEKDLQELNERVKRLESRIETLEEIISPLEDEMRARARSLKFRMAFDERMKRDERVFEPKERQEIEELYHTAVQQWNTVTAKESLKILAEKYGKSNRAGCGVLYLSQMHMGKQKRDYLKKAIKDHGDCWYGDGVQVGAYARFLLGVYYLDTGDKKEAEKLFIELLNKYPDAIDHKGNMLKDIIKEMNK